MGIDAEMFVRTRAKVTAEQVTKKAHALVSAFGTGVLSVLRPGVIGDYQHHALAIVPEWEQDGDTIRPDKGETFIRVYLWGRYYGKGYERGDIVSTIAVAQWLEAHFPGGSVWYGGDSSGVCAAPFGAAERADLWAHFCAVGHDPYMSGRGEEKGQWGVCDFCGGAPMRSCGGGHDREFVYCSGCGLKHVRNPRTGNVIEVPRGKDFFDVKGAP